MNSFAGQQRLCGAVGVAQQRQRRSSNCTAQERLRGATPCPRSGAVAVLCWSNHEDIPTSKVGAERGKTDWNNNHIQLANLITGPQSCLTQWNEAMPCGATQDGRVMVESSDRMWSTGEGNGKPLQYSCFENPMNSMKRQKDRTLNIELPRSVGAQYATGDQWRNNSRKNEETKTSKLCWIGVVRVGSLVLFLISGEMLSISHHWG